VDECKPLAGGRIFAGSARRARVWVNDARGAGWEAGAYTRPLFSST